MRILFFSSVFPDCHASTRGTFNLELCRALSVEHDVRVIAPRPWPEVLRRRSQGQKIEATQDMRSEQIDIQYPSYWYTPKVLRHRYGSFMWSSVRSTVTELFRDFVPECVVSYWAHPDGEAGLRAAQLAGATSTVIIGGSDVLVITKDQKRRQRITQILQESTTVVSVSNGLAKSVSELGVDKARVHTVYQGVDRDKFNHGNKAAARDRLDIPLDQKSIIWVGRADPIKGLDVLIEACTLMRKNGDNVVTYLIGDGAARATIEAEVGRLGLQDSVRFTGSVAHDRLPDWYQAADATVMSSHSEGLPNVLRESLACGTPFVSTDVGSISEIADPKYSILVPPRDPVTLAKSMVAILDDKHRCAAQEYRPSSWSDCARELTRVLETYRRPKPADETLNTCADAHSNRDLQNATGAR